MAPTQPAQASPESVRSASHPSLKSQDPVSVKAEQVLRVLNSKGNRARLEDVKKFISGVDPQRLFKLTPDQIANAFIKKTSN
jgi:hypothetical protein